MKSFLSCRWCHRTFVYIDVIIFILSDDDFENKIEILQSHYSLISWVFRMTFFGICFVLHFSSCRLATVFKLDKVKHKCFFDGGTLIKKHTSLVSMQKPTFIKKVYMQHLQIYSSLGLKSRIWSTVQVNS